MYTLNAELVQENNIYMHVYSWRPLQLPSIIGGVFQAWDHPVNKLLGQTINMHKIPEHHSTVF